MLDESDDSALSNSSCFRPGTYSLRSANSAYCRRNRHLVLSSCAVWTGELVILAPFSSTCKCLSLFQMYCWPCCLRSYGLARFLSECCLQQQTCDGTCSRDSLCHHSPRTLDLCRRETPSSNLQVDAALRLLDLS